jgi:serine/threonine protein kinase
MTTAGQKESAATAPSEIGTVLAQRYEAVRELGRGGMGVVYLCRDVVTGDRVALKRLRSPEKGETRPEENWWFHQEARAVALLDHPAIVRARDFGQLADGSPFFVMDVLPGRSIHEWMHTTHLPWTVIWAAVDQVLAGLAHSHARGVIHGDLKPSNIMLDLATSGKGPRAFLLDLGLAWLREYRHDSRLDGARAPEVAVHSGAGTVGWVAPEQIRRQAALVGPATDLYALGCVMYRVLSGREVFEGNAQDVLRAHKRTPVPMPTLPDDVPPEAGKFVVRLLEKKPWNRFEFAADARKAWMRIKPPMAVTLEEIVQSSPSSRAAPAAYARSLAPGLLSLRAPMLVARHDERQELWSAVEQVASGKMRAGAHRAHRRGRRRQEPPRRVALRRGPRARGDAPAARALRSHPDAARRHHGAINAHFGLEGADRASVEQTLITRWEVAQGRRRRAAWVAATAEWLRPTPPGVSALGPSGKRFVLDTDPSSASSSSRRSSSDLSKDRPVLSGSTTSTTRRPTRSSALPPPPGRAELPLLIVATARSETLETDLDAALRMEAMRAEWSGKVLELKPLAHGRHRGAAPRHPAARRRRREARRRAEPRQPALRAAAAARVGRGRLPQDGERQVPRPRATPSRARHHHRRAVGRALRAVPTELRLSGLRRRRDRRRHPRRRAEDARAPRSGWTRATRSSPSRARRSSSPPGNDQFRWPHALLQEHLLERLTSATTRPRSSASRQRARQAPRRRLAAHHEAPRDEPARAGDDDTRPSSCSDFIAARGGAGATRRPRCVISSCSRGASAARTTPSARYWRGEALRSHRPARGGARQAEKAQRVRARGGHGERGARAAAPRHIASDLAQPAQGSGARREGARTLREAGGRRRARAGRGRPRRDRLPARGPRAGRADAQEGLERCTEVGDVLGRAQCLILLALIEETLGGFERGRELLGRARGEFDGIGYRLGLAQCDSRSATPTTAPSTSPEPAPGPWRRAPASASCRTRAARPAASASSR